MTHRGLRALGTALATAVLAYLGTGLHPVPALTWLAPLPVLLLAPRVSWRLAGPAAFAGWILGYANVWTFYASDLEMPVPLLVGCLVVLSAAFAGLVLAYRALLLRGRALSATLATAAGWAALEYVLSLVTPHGAYLSVAYTQTDVLPVTQLASLTGVWGISFLLLGVPAALATLRRPPVVAAALTAAAVLGYGAWHLTDVPAPRTTARVALLELPAPNGEVPVDSPAGRAHVAAYVTRLREVTADVVVLPEVAFRADENTLSLLTGPFTAVAAERGFDLVVGLALTEGGVARNVALNLSPTGPPVRYVKHHLVPGLEDRFAPGEGLAFGRPDRGLVICKDLDFPDLVRDYRLHGADLLLAPAWDFDVDAWLHSRMAVMRGVESGVTIARTGRDGTLVITDPRGHVLAEGDGGLVVAEAGLWSRPTPYARWGDWFAWLCLVLLCGVWGAAFVARRRQRRAGGGAVTS
ncbi:nitrilase-related carbon-nitrogen hydrolase [Longispora urticae]